MILALLLLTSKITLPAKYSPSDDASFLSTDKSCFVFFKKHFLAVAQKISSSNNSQENSYMVNCNCSQAKSARHKAYYLAIREIFAILFFS